MAFTTYDHITQSVTQEAPLNKVGDRQIYAGQEYAFTGTKWIVLEDHEKEF
jgi:hypothetical protein